MIRLSPQASKRMARIRASRDGLGDYLICQMPTAWSVQLRVGTCGADSVQLKLTLPLRTPKAVVVWFRDRVLEAAENRFCPAMPDLTRAICLAKTQAFERAAALIENGAVPYSMDLRQEGERLLAGWRERRATDEDDEDAPATAPVASYNPYGHTPFERAWEERHEAERHCGMGWQDMPGCDRAEKKLNWYLWLHGEFAVEDYPSIDPTMAARYRQSHPVDARCLVSETV